MGKLLCLLVVAMVMSAALALKEWKNFENGKVYSHKMLNDDPGFKLQATQKPPPVPERILHSHHRDKKSKSNVQQNSDPKPIRSKNLERHHRKNMEEEMHLRPLNERHHKYPNPALLTPNRNPIHPTQATKQTVVKEVKNLRRNNKRRERGKKRNKQDQKTEFKNENTSESNQLARDVTTKKPFSKSPEFSGLNNGIQSVRFRNSFPSKIPSYW